MPTEHSIRLSIRDGSKSGGSFDGDSIGRKNHHRRNFHEPITATTVNRIARLNIDGTLDTGFMTGTGMNSTLDAIAIQPSDGKIVVGGAFATYNGTTVNRFARLNTDGTLDTTFATGTSASGKFAQSPFSPTVKFLSAAVSLPSTARPSTASPESTQTAIWTRHLPEQERAIPFHQIALQADGKLVVGGLFTTAGGASRNRIARFNADGTFDASFDPGIGPASERRPKFSECCRLKTVKL